MAWCGFRGLILAQNLLSKVRAYELLFVQHVSEPSLTDTEAPGAAECLQNETAHLNIEVFLMVLGQFRTEILSEKRRYPRSKNSISDYDSVSESLSQRHIETDGKQPGNPQLAIERIIDVVRREGRMKGAKNLPLRIPLGSDAVQIMRAKCNETLNILTQYEEFARSTDYSDQSEVPSYYQG